jgi:hypothetical protein
MKHKALLAIVLFGYLGVGLGEGQGQVCSVDTLTANFLPCNDNGTSQPTDDFFIADFTTTFTNRPIVGNIELEVGGQTFSTSVAGLGSQFQFLSIHLPADGLPVQATIRFTADAGCTLTQPVGTAPGPCSVACSVDDLTATFLPCNDNGTFQPTDDFFIADFTTTFTNPPTVGNIELEVDGQTFSTSVAGLGSQLQFLSIPLPADGQGVVATVRFSAIPTCTLTAGVGAAPSACSVPPVSPAPALSRWGTVLSLLILIAISALALRQQRRLRSRHGSE